MISIEQGKTHKKQMNSSQRLDYAQWNDVSTISLRVFDPKAPRETKSGCCVMKCHQQFFLFVLVYEWWEY